ncbi:MAG TPA: low temperature requirement protein A [Herpetosiphonaceae bacterium]
MTTHAGDPSKPRGWAVPMRPRSPAESHRASTPLELLFDLVFVVAVAQAAAALHHGIAENHALQALGHFCQVFFAIWWAWMNFTWFASAYDTDDVPYRLAVFVQLSGALIIAAGIQSAFAGDFLIVVVGYVVMRLGLVSQWLRASRADPAHRVATRRYATGLGAVQLGWIGLLAVPAAWQTIGFVTLVLIELAIPIWAEQIEMTSWHPGHIAERYGLFTIIVLGESILSASLAIQQALAAGELRVSMAPIIAGGLLIVFFMWWLYFDEPIEDRLTSRRAAFLWGYGHLFIFGAAASVGAGLAAAVDIATGHAQIGRLGGGFAVALPVALYLLCLWALHRRHDSERGASRFFCPVAALLIALTPLTGQAILLSGLLLAGLQALLLVWRQRAKPL